MLIAWSAVMSLSHAKYKPSVGFCGRESVNQTIFSNVLNNDSIGLRFVEAKCRSLVNIDKYFTMRFKVISSIYQSPSECTIFYYKDDVDQEISKSFLDESVGFLRYIFDTNAGVAYVDTICTYLTSNNVVRVPNSPRVEINEIKKYILITVCDVVLRSMSYFERLTLSEIVIDYKLNLIDRLNLYKPISDGDIFSLKTPILICLKTVEENKGQMFKVIKLRLLQELRNYNLEQDSNSKYDDTKAHKYELYKTIAKQLIDIKNIMDIAQLLERSFIYKEFCLFKYRPLYTSGIILNAPIRNNYLRLQRCLIINLEDICPFLYYRFYKIVVQRYCEKSLLQLFMCGEQSTRKSKMNIHHYFDYDTNKIVIPFSECIDTESIKIVITNAFGVLMCKKVICVYDLIKL